MRPVRRVIVAFGALAALAHCSSTPPPPPVTAPPPAVAVAPEPDLSAVPVPPSLMFTARTPSPRALAERVGDLAGMGRVLVQTLEGSLPGMLGRDEGLASVVDLAAPADVAVYWDGEAREPRLVLAFGAVSLDRAETLLSDGHRLVAGPNDVRRIERTASGDGDGEGASGASIHCVLAPAFGASARRLVCAETASQVEPMVAFLTRTLPRAPLAADGSDLVLEAAVAQLQETFGGEARRAAEEIVRDANPDPDPNNPQFQQAVRDWVRDTLAASVPQGLADLASAKLTLALPTTGLTATLDVGLARTTAPLVRQAVEATRDAAVPADLLGRLPGGGYGYGGGSVDLAPLRQSVNLLASAAAWAIVPRARLAPADATALRDALAALAAQDRLAGAFAVGADDQGRYWNATAVRLTTPPAQFVTNARALLAAVRRRPIAAAVRAEHRVDVAQWREVRGAGVPAGALLLRVPPPAPATPAARPPPGAPRGPRTPPVPPTEVLLAPAGDVLWVVVAPDARAQYRAVTTQTTAPVPPERLTGGTGGGIGMAGAIVPAGLPNLFRADPQIGSSLRLSAQRAADRGQTPVTVQFSNAARDGVTHLTARLEAPQSVARMIAGAFGTNTPGGSPPPSSQP